MRIRRRYLALAIPLLQAWASPAQARAAAPPSKAQAAERVEAAPTAPVAALRGRVRERGSSRAPISGATVIVVDAPADVRPGKRAEQPLDPDHIAWMHESQTDADGIFELPGVPVGALRVVVVAGGYARLEQWAELEAKGGELELYLEPDRDGPYRTVVATKRRSSWTEIEPLHTLDGRQARHYPGSGDDPVLAAMNLPGVARGPAGLGLTSFRGGDPREVGIYVDGHPVPRAFHVIPMASVLSPPMIAGIELSPGNYPASYGGFGGGLVQVTSRPGRRDGIHGEAHLDLFDVGATTEGPVGKGSVHVGVRRSHVGEILRAIPLPNLTAPNFWDYMTRLDHPLGGGHAIGLRGFGAGDRLRLSDYFDFRSSFHRFDFDYRFERGAWQVLVSPSLRLDHTNLNQSSDDRFARRKAQVYSLRAAFGWQALEWLALDFGADAVVESWRRRQHGQLTFNSDAGFYFPSSPEEFDGAQLRFGAWLATALRLGDWSLIPSVRLNVFAYGPKPSVRVDPRVHLRGPLSERAQVFASAGLYAIPIAGAHERGTTGPLEENSGFGSNRVDIPEYLLTYFDPAIGGESIGRYASATTVTHASVGFEAELPWDVDLRALGFFRSARAHTPEYEPITDDPDQPFTGVPLPELEYYGRRRAMGLELLLRRNLAPGLLDGWLGYTLLFARTEDQPNVWLPAVFDQRHNFVALLSVALPHEIRVGLRFRLGSGNPLEPITAREVIPLSVDEVYYLPLRGPRGSEYQPLFHQLDIRIDKTWIRDRASVSVYFDVQNVYNHWYPEIWIYSYDWSAREQAIGLPIYPSLGLSVSY
ncbi:TonB-dependent receptor [Enhygromyxa salina]|uniref:Uncharacterized protein n=1 Tax=Enhygromyxa salina TaxID=215803 RepID=A0A2S9YNB6_9BACT|nr:TonB-dependent receptor [Enhygromyxa salina]PRQ06578.1 hypothetical protein ENSA7_37310 [Enhygromyxa salina]